MDSSLNRHLIVVEGFGYPNHPRSDVLMPLVKSSSKVPVTMSLGWSGNTMGQPLKSWRKCLG